MFHNFRLSSQEPLITLTLNAEENLTVRRDVMIGQGAGVEVCDLLNLVPRQRRMCRRQDVVVQTLLRASQLAHLECQFQFKDARWNCTLGQHRYNLLQKGTDTHIIIKESTRGGGEWRDLPHVLKKCLSNEIPKGGCCYKMYLFINSEAFHKPKFLQNPTQISQTSASCDYILLTIIIDS